MAVETKEYRAEAKFQRVSPQKARLVLELIKGRGVQEALETAAFTKKRIAPGDSQAADFGGRQRQVRGRRARASIWTWTACTSSRPWPTTGRA